MLEKDGAKISDAQAPDGPFEDAAELTILIEAASAFQEMVKSGDCGKLKDPLGQVNGYPSQEFTATDYLQVQRVRTILQQKMDKLFDDFDVVVAAGSNSRSAVAGARASRGPRSRGASRNAGHPACRQ